MASYQPTIGTPLKLVDPKDGECIDELTREFILSFLSVICLILKLSRRDLSENTI
jgi:hypothetical protein